MIHRSSILHCACRLVLLKTKYSLGPPKDCHFFLLLSIMFQHLFYLIFIDTIYFIMAFFIIIDIFVLH
jgi:hypothetical protein